MTLKDRINEDMKAAMKARQTERLAAIRLLLAAMKQKEVDERIQLSDADVIVVMEKMLKQRRDSIIQFESAGRIDLAEKEKFEASVIQAYMPEALSDLEIGAIVEAAIAETGGAGAQDMGKIMRIVKFKVAGRADMGVVSALIKAKLTG